MNVSRPKFAADGLATNLRNAQLASFFEFGFIFAAALGSGRKRTMQIEILGYANTENVFYCLISIITSMTIENGVL